MPRTRRYPPVTWPVVRHGRRWTDDEIDEVARRLTWCARATIARVVGRTPRAIEALQQRRAGLWATTQAYVTASALAREWAVSPQYVATLCRRGRLPAHRVPGGRWWLIDPTRAMRRCP